MRDRSDNPMVEVDGAWVGPSDVYEDGTWRLTGSVGEILTARLIRSEIEERAVMAHLEAQME